MKNIWVVISLLLIWNACLTFKVIKDSRYLSTTGQVAFTSGLLCSRTVERTAELKRRVDAQHMLLQEALGLDKMPDPNIPDDKKDKITIW